MPDARGSRGVASYRFDLREYSLADVWLESFGHYQVYAHP